MASAAEHAHDSRATAPEDVATEYVAGLFAGERVDPATYRARLADESERAAFDELVRGAERAGRSLPCAASEGTLLSDRYRVVRELDEGRTARVFAARGEELARKVAIEVRLQLRRHPWWSRIAYTIAASLVVWLGRKLE